MVLYQSALALSVAALVGVLAVTHPTFGNGWAVAGLAAAAGLAERGRIRLSEKVETSISLVPTVFAAALFGPLAAMIVAAASFASEFPLFLTAERRASFGGAAYLRWSTYTSVRAICGAVAGCGVWLVNANFGTSIAEVIACVVVAALIVEPLDVAFNALTLRVRGGRAADSIRALGPLALASMTFYTPIVGMLAVAYTQLSPWTLAFFFVPALAAQRLFGLYQGQRELAVGLVEVNAQLERANLSFASALVATLDARDRYTAGHSAAVAVYARDIAARLGLETEQQQLAYLCGLVHDIGKIGLSAGLLEKPGALTLEERKEMMRHSEIGWDILRKVDTYAEIAAVVRHHHERMDGEGYPDHIVGEEIPLLSRIIAVADAYNAMTSDRPYRDAMPSRVARLRLAQAVESQFDTSIVAAFEAILAGSDEGYRCARGEAFELRFGESTQDFEPLKLAVG